MIRYAISLALAVLRPSAKRAVLFPLTTAAVLASTPLERLHATTLTTLYNFDTAPGVNGTSPAAGLTLGSDGNFYGTTSGGGAGSGGTIFRCTPTGVVTVLHAFNGSDGLGPTGALIQTSDGSFYGTTHYGGTGNNGTVFRLAPDGTLVTLHFFNGTDGSEPTAGLISGSDGNFYGTATFGGVNNDGTVFRLAPDGTFATLHDFSGQDGKYLNAALVLGSDGNFYGTTRAGGTSNDGTVFRLAPDGTFTSLYQFSGSDGNQPLAALVQGADGDFYGVTENGGTGTAGLGGGTIFRLTPDGALTTLHNFSGTDGTSPLGALVQGSDGNFYGTTSTAGPALGAYDDGSYSTGTLFRITPAGVLTTLRGFDRADVVTPSSALIQDASGNFYGTAAGIDNGDGSKVSNGSVYEVSLDAAPATPVVTASVVVLKADAATDDERYGTVVLSLSTAPASTIKVKYLIRGSAVAGIDYETLSGKVKFKAGQTSKVISVVPRSGVGRQSLSVVKLVLQPGNGYTLATTTPLKVKILPSP